MSTSQYYPQPVTTGLQYPAPMSYTSQPRMPYGGSVPYDTAYGASYGNSSYSDFRWVQGEAGAKAFTMPPNSRALLLDSESPVFYIKVTDMSGMPQPLRIFDYTERVATASLPAVDESNYVTRNEFNDLRKMIDDLTAPNPSSNTERRA